MYLVKVVSKRIFKKFIRYRTSQDIVIVWDKIMINTPVIINCVSKIQSL